MLSTRDLNLVYESERNHSLLLVIVQPDLAHLTSVRIFFLITDFAQNRC